jgi:hypothetical protein
MNTTTASYLYAFTAPMPATALDGVCGVAGAPVRVIGVRGIGCLVSTVDLATFGEEPLRRNLEDLGWLQQVAVEHDTVVRVGAAVTTTAPLRLATMCADDDAVRERLQELHDRAAALLSRLAGRDEWGVKLLGATPAAGAEPVDATSGTAYLQQRRAALRARETSAAATQRQVEDVYEHLLRAAIAGHRHRPQDERLSGLGQPMLLNAAFLVARADVQVFRRHVDEIARTVPPDAFVLTGPWPPYSFAALDES